MMATQEKPEQVVENFGQFSLVSYVHQLRGERVNLGVLVWHPFLGSEVRFAKSLQRVRCVDDGADLDRMRKELERIQTTVQKWSDNDRSPLEPLAAEFRHGLVVSEPSNARICSPASTLERLYSSLVSPEPFARASSNRQFARAFAGRFKAVLEEKRVKEFQTDFTEKETFQPIRVAAWYKRKRESFLWRAFSFAAFHSGEQQLLAAKAIHAENVDLKALPKYSRSHLAIAVQLPKPGARASWMDSSKWLERKSDRVEIFEDRQSLEEKVPQLF
jgi:hypothetical protein